MTVNSALDSVWRFGRQGSADLQRSIKQYVVAGAEMMRKTEPLEEHNGKLWDAGNAGVARWQVVESGEAGTYAYQLMLQSRAGKILSPWNDVPLWTSDRQNVHVICKTPRGMWTDLEVSMEGSKPSLKLRITSQGKLSHYAFNSPWNIGMLPQSWADPDLQNANYGGLPYDGLPMEVIDIGSRKRSIGEVYTVKILGGFAVVNAQGGDLSWKVLAIDLEDQMAGKLQDVKDVHHNVPYLLEEVREWLRSCRCVEPEAKENIFGLNERAANRASLMKVVTQAHASWQQLTTGKRQHRGMEKSTSAAPSAAPIPLSDPNVGSESETSPPSLPNASVSSTEDHFAAIPEALKIKAHLARPAFLEALELQTSYSIQLKRALKSALRTSPPDSVRQAASHLPFTEGGTENERSRKSEKEVMSRNEGEGVSKEEGLEDIESGRGERKGGSGPLRPRVTFADTHIGSGHARRKHISLSGELHPKRNARSEVLSSGAVALEGTWKTGGMNRGPKTRVRPTDIAISAGMEGSNGERGLRGGRVWPAGSRNTAVSVGKLEQSRGGEKVSVGGVVGGIKSNDVQIWLRDQLQERRRSEGDAHLDGQMKVNGGGGVLRMRVEDERRRQSQLDGLLEERVMKAEAGDREGAYEEVREVHVRADGVWEEAERPRGSTEKEWEVAEFEGILRNSQDWRNGEGNLEGDSYSELHENIPVAIAVVDNGHEQHGTHPIAQSVSFGRYMVNQGTTRLAWSESPETLLGPTAVRRMENVRYPGSEGEETVSSTNFSAHDAENSIFHEDERVSGSSESTSRFDRSGAGRRVSWGWVEERKFPRGSGRGYEKVNGGVLTSSQQLPRLARRGGEERDAGKRYMGGNSHHGAVGYGWHASHNGGKLPTKYRSEPLGLQQLSTEQVMERLSGRPRNEAEARAVAAALQKLRMHTNA